MPRFYTWLRTQLKDETAFGDLARDAKHDHAFPRDVKTFSALYRHLVSQNACPAALDVAKEAWLAWGGTLDFDPDADSDEDADENTDENGNDPELSPADDMIYV